MPLALRAFLGLLLALVPAGTVLLLLERDSRMAREAQEVDETRRLVQRVANRQAATLDAARQFLSAIGTGPIAQDGSCAASLRRVLAANPRYLTADLADAAGRVVCTSRPTVPAGFDLKGALGAEALQVGAFQPASGGALTLTEPLRDATGRVTSAAAVALSLDWLAADLRAMQLPARTVATIADRNGTILATTRHDGPTPGSPLAGPARRFLQGPASGVVDANGEDGLRHLAYIPPDQGPGGLFLSVGFQEAPVAVAGTSNDMALMIVGGLLLSFLLGLAIFHTSAEIPVQALLATARRWRAQDGSARVGRIGGGSDFRRLAAAFDGMAQTVEARQRAEARWQACMEAAPIFVLAADRTGGVEWVNALWREATGLDRSKSRGNGWLDAIAPDDRPAFEAAWRAAREHPHGTPLLQELRLRSGHRCLFQGAPALSGNQEVPAWALFGLDVQELRQAEELAEETNAHLRSVYAHAPVGLCLLDRDLRFLAVNDRLARAHGRAVSDHLGRGLAELAPRFARELEARLRSVIATGAPLEEIEVATEVDGEERLWLCSYHAVRSHSGAVNALTGAVMDITAWRSMEDSTRELSHEVDHRAQNALSVVRGLLRLTAADAPDDVPALVEELEGRIGAMSRAHDLLSRENWLGADLGEVVVRELVAHSGHIEASGPPIRLRTEAVQPLALTLYELVSNAQRHGAFSRTGGRLVVSWARAANHAELRWTERGGPRLAGAPTRTGLGSLLIDANTGTQLAGNIQRDWGAEGLSCILTIGAEALAAGPAPGRADASPLQGLRVLLVEDEAASGFIAALREEGCQVVGPVRSATEALLLAEQLGRVDVLLFTSPPPEQPVQQLSKTLRSRVGLVLHLPPERGGGQRLSPPELRNALVKALAAPRAG